MDAYEIINIISAAINYPLTPYQLQTQAFFSTSDIIALVVAVVAIIGAVITTIMSIKSSHKNNISSARIEWIQNVRASVAKLISVCYEMVMTNIENKTNINFSIVNEKAHLLILYFGPEDEKGKPVELLSETSNRGKNKQIVALIIEIKSILVNEKIQVWDKLKNQINMVEANLYRYNEQNRCYDEHLIEELEHLAEQSSIYKILFDKLDLLSNAIRIYLKLEWKKAKKGR
ncbi:MAG: hypothetical protein FWC71_08515 [Defluviitaleaceae bacterium]|nr:hypothetical protein [Defluviitaleaceae bacterium]